MKSQSKEEIVLNFSVKKCVKTQSYKMIVESNDKTLDLKHKFETELIYCMNDGEEINFKEKLKLNFNFAERQKLRVIFFKKVFVDKNLNYKIQTLTKETELSSIISSPNSIYERYFNEEFKDKDIFCIKANKVETTEGSKINIYDFIKSGIKLNIFLAFDFSNGKNRTKREKSLMNYSKILSNLAQKIFHYTKKQSIYLYGYGCKLNKPDEDLFNFSEENDKPILLKEICKIFGEKQKSIIPGKNVIISKLIINITKLILKLYETRNYNILFIFARELPYDKDKQTLIDAFIESSYLPLTIIVIGEGQNDFQKINQFFGAQIKEASSGLERNSRNNILFTSFIESFGENEEELIQWCLEQISNQMIEFYDIIKITPKQIWEKDVKAIKDSFMQYEKKSICIYKSYSQQNDINDNKNNGNKNQKQNDNKNEENLEKNKIENINSNNNNININQDNINNQKYTPTGSINTNIPQINTYKIQRKYDKFQTPQGNEEKNKQKHKLESGKSILTFSPNPFNKKETIGKETDNPDIKKKYFIPGESICENMINNDKNPFKVNKIKKEEKQKSESKMESYNISTEESSKLSSNINTKISTGLRFNINYSVDN